MLIERSILPAPLESSDDAFNVMFARYRRPIVRLAYSITCDHEESLDIAQDTFLRAYVRFDDPSFVARAIPSWLFVVARNASFDSVRRRKHGNATVVQPSGAQSWGPHEVVEFAEQRRTIRRALASLTERHRRAVELFYFDGLSYREIADRLALPLGTVKTFIFRGIRSLRTGRHRIAMQGYR